MKRKLHLDEIEKEAAAVAAQLAPEGDEATLLLLRGELGSGKTTFTKALARAYGIEDDVTSPTFVIEKIYMPQKSAFERFVHIDAYRLKSTRELEALRWKELRDDAKNLIVIEWPERIEDALPKEAKEISFAFVDEKTRELDYKNIW